VPRRQYVRAACTAPPACRAHAPCRHVCLSALALPRPAGPPRARGRRKHKRYLAGKLASWLLASPVARPLRSSSSASRCRGPARAPRLPGCRVPRRARARPVKRTRPGRRSGRANYWGRPGYAQALRRRGTGYVCSYRATHPQWPGRATLPRAATCLTDAAMPPSLGLASTAGGALACWHAHLCQLRGAEGAG